MKANPGGQIAPGDVIGRDALIEQLWHIVERQSLILIAERRMGKTSILRKMVAEAPAGKLPVYRDLESVRTPLEFVQLVFDDVGEYLSRSGRTANRVQRILTQLGGAEIGGILKIPPVAAPHWKTLLPSVIEDLMEQQDRMVILLWDEVPLMLHNIKQRDGANAAMEILDLLRSLRQEHPGLRMVFTGSIGLHSVITSLRKLGYANAPTNDMHTVDVPPLSPPVRPRASTPSTRRRGHPDRRHRCHRPRDCHGCGRHPLLHPPRRGPDGPAPPHAQRRSRSRDRSGLPDRP